MNAIPWYLGPLFLALGCGPLLNPSQAMSGDGLDGGGGTGHGSESAGGGSAAVSLRADAIRTPEERFTALPGFSFSPKYVVIDGLRTHYLDEGPAGGQVVLLLHGEPSWSYLYRKVIPILTQAGFRAIAPDLIGFGRSDKLMAQSSYSVAFHVRHLEKLMAALNLTEVVMFAQDWGSIIGLRVVALHPDWFARIAIGNGTLPRPPRFTPSDMAVVSVTGTSANPPSPAPYEPLYQPPPNLELPPFPSWDVWRQYAANVTPLYPSIVLQQFTTLDLPPGVLAAYDAPFPDERYTAGAHVFPSLATTEAADFQAAWQVLRTYNRPFLTIYGDRDPVLGDQGIVFRSLVPGAVNQPHAWLVDAGHFVQEDRGELLAERLVDWLRQ